MQDARPISRLTLVDAESRDIWLFNSVAAIEIVSAEANMDSKQLLVADVMTIDPIVVADDAPLEDAARLLRTYSISGLPVVDGEGTLVGVISQTDIVAIEEAPIGRLIRTESSGLRVGELMTSPAITVPMTGSLAEAARLMRDRRIHRLVALSDDGRPVGVLSASDFVALYAEE